MNFIRVHTVICGSNFLNEQYWPGRMFSSTATLKLAKSSFFRRLVLHGDGVLLGYLVRVFGELAAVIS